MKLVEEVATLTAMLEAEKKNTPATTPATTTTKTKTTGTKTATTTTTIVTKTAAGIGPASMRTVGPVGTK